jgi:UDP-N-acetylmuramoylalanine--D-glutamate ligase
MKGLTLTKKRIAIIGFGISGASVARYFLAKDVCIDVFEDKKESDFKSDLLKEIKTNKNFNIYFSDTRGQFDVLVYDYIIASPGVPLTHPIIQEAILHKVEYLTDINTFLKIFRATYPQGTVISITGSNGKSTTVTLLYDALRSLGLDVYLGGNIGISPLDFFEHIQTDKPIIILETSSYQLEYMNSKDYFDIACILNLSDNHLNRYGGKKDLYAQAKLGGIHNEYTDVILNFDDEYTQKYIIPHLTSKRVVGISFEHPDIHTICTLENNSLIHPHNKTVYLEDVSKMKLKGLHNIYNCAYVCAVLNLLEYSITQEVKKTLYDFTGLTHRIQYVDVVHDVTYINDSKSTSPDATKKALTTIGQIKNVLLISGGNDKDISYQSMQEEWVHYVKSLILLPGTANLKLKSLAQVSDVDVLAEVQTMQEACDYAYKNAQPGDIVLLSPATDSHASFASYEDRGNQFMECIKKLKIQ